MTTGILVVNFGEPAEPTLDDIVPFLERIFLQNSGMEGISAQEERRKRAHHLAVQRAPALMEEYEEIGGSPLNAQADAQADALAGELRSRGHDVTAYSCFQFTAPFVEEAVHRARTDGMQRVVALPVYPLCGHSTTVAALRQFRAAVEAEEGWSPEIVELSGWHRHPDFYPMHADNVRAFARREGIDLTHPETAFLFSVHGTPLCYLEEGSRYDRYVEEACAGIARELGLSRYHVGYQNHSNRPVEWTQPDVDVVLKGIDAERVVVLPVAFMHEQSETLAELDREMRDEAEEAGLAFHRVPVPHDDPRFVALLADVVEAGMGHGAGTERLQLRRCLCRKGGGARCTNGLRLDSLVVPGEEAQVRA